MPRKRKDRPGQLGDFWLSRRKNSAMWCRTWFDERTRQTKRASLGTEDFSEAEIKLAEWVVTNGEMRGNRPESVALETVLVRYYQNHAIHQRSAEQARYALRRWSDSFPEALVSDVTPARLRAFADAMRAEGLSSGYVRRTLAIGQAAINRAQREGEITAVPRIDLSIAPEGEPRERLLSPEEVLRLFDAAESDHAFLYLMLAFGTAARPEAILELTAAQVDVENRLIRLNPPGRSQNKKRRPTIPMCESLVPWLTGLLAGPVVRYTPQLPEGIAERTKATPKPRALAGIRTTINRLKARARQRLRDEAARLASRARRTGRRGEAWTLLQEARQKGDALLEITAYTIRHTVASEMRRRGVPVWEVAGFLGHSSGYRTTERYAKFGPDHLSQAVRAIDAYFADLGLAVEPDSDQSVTRLRASCVLPSKPDRAQVIGKLVDLTGESLNQLFNTLEEWNTVLEASASDPSPFP